MEPVQMVTRLAKGPSGCYRAVALDTVIMYDSCSSSFYWQYNLADWEFVSTPPNQIGGLSYIWLFATFNNEPCGCQYDDDIHSCQLHPP